MQEWPAHLDWRFSANLTLCSRTNGYAKAQNAKNPGNIINVTIEVRVNGASCNLTSTDEKSSSVKHEVAKKKHK